MLDVSAVCSRSEPVVGHSTSTIAAASGMSQCSAIDWSYYLLVAWFDQFVDHLSASNSCPFVADSIAPSSMDSHPKHLDQLLAFQSWQISHRWFWPLAAKVVSWKTNRDAS